MPQDVVNREKEHSMSVSAVPTVLSAYKPPASNTNPVAPRDPDHDGDVDKAGQLDNDSSRLLNIKA